MKKLFIPVLALLLALGFKGDVAMPTFNELISRYTAQSQMDSFFTDKMGVISVKAFGAIADGATDDTAAVQAAIDAANEIGAKAIFFPKGSYRLGVLTDHAALTFYSFDEVVFTNTSYEVSNFSTMADLAYVDAQLAEKADQSDLDETNARLAQTPTKQELENVEYNLSLKRNKFEKIEPEDWSERALALVTGDGTINIESIPQNQSVSREKYDKAILSNNLFDKDREVKGHTLNSSGALVVGASRNTSDFIPVIPGTNYTFNNVDIVAFYSKDKEYISRIAFGSSEADKIKTIETPESSYFIRFSYLNDSGGSSISIMDKVMVNEGDIAIGYEPYYFKLPDLIVDEENLSENVKEGLVAKEYTLNLFDKHTIKEFTGLSHLSGSEEPSETRNTSDFIPVKENTEYSFISGRHVCFYAKNKQYIDGIDTHPDSTNSFVTPEGTYYIRFDYYRNSIEDDKQMLFEGNDVPSEYVPYGFTIKHLITDFSSKEEEEKIEKITGFSSWEDFIIIDDEFWGFQRSDKSGLGYYENGIGHMFIHNSDGTLIKTLRHNFGHANTVDYNPVNDTLILGSGSGYYDLDEWIYIIKNVNHWSDLPEDTLLDLENENIQGSQITKIFVGREFGDKVNVVWGEDNFDQYNICHAISNDGKDIRKLLLGKGNNELEDGQFIAGRSEDEFNGTYKMLGHWETDVIDVIQGGCWYNGYLWLGLGHDGLWVGRYKLNWDGTLKIEQKHEKYYYPDGTLYDNAPTAGIAIKDGFIYHRVRDSRSAINKYPVF